MSFNKKTIKINKKRNIFANILGVLAIFLIFLLWIFLIWQISKINFNFYENIIPISSNEDYEEKEEKNKEKTNILIIWRWWGNHDAPNLTDTIILASINHKKDIISLLSIPRDLYVEYPNWKSWKINEIYRIFTKIYWDKQKWIKILENKVSQITGEKIDYYLNIDFEWFIKVIDTFWWIEITLEKNFVDEKFPDDKLWYTTFVLRKWTWNIDWEVALKYARSRHSTSDFDRSLRQQQVLRALKEKIESEWLLKSTWKIKKLYSIFKDYVDTDLDLQTLIKLSKIAKQKEKIDILSFNLNDSCFYWTTSCVRWWILYIPLREYFSWASVLLPNWADKNNLNNYKEVKKYTDLIFNKQEIFIENHEINVFNSLKINFLASEIADNIKKYWFNVPEKNSIGNTKKVYEKSIVYYNNIEEDSKTLKSLKQFLPGLEFKKVENSIYSKQETTKIEIIIWEDHKKMINF